MAEPNQLLNAISTSVIDYLQKSKKAEEVTAESARQAGVISSQSEQVLLQSAEDRAAIARQEGLANLQAQQARRSAVLAAGTDPTTGAGSILELIGTIRQKQVETTQLLGKYRQEQETRLIDDPLTWIKAQVDWDNTGEKLAGAAKELNVADSNLTSLNTALQQTFRTTEAVKESITPATIEASARLAASDATLRAQQAAIEGLKYNAAEVSAAATGSKDRLDAVYNLLSAQNQDQQMRMALEQFKLSKEKFNWEREERELNRVSKEQGRMVDELTLDYINRSLGSMGQPLLTGPEVQSSLQLLKSGASKELAYHYQNGRRIVTTGVSMLGNSPAESVEVLEGIPSNLPTMRGEVAALLAQVASEFDSQSTPQAKQTAMQDPKNGRVSYINKQTQERINTQFSSIAPGTGNLFDVGDIKSYVSYEGNPGLREFQGVPLVTKLLGPAIAAGQPLSDPKQVLGLGIESVRKGTLTSSEFVSGVVDVYRRANEINQAERGLKGFGIVPPDAGRHYYAQLGAGQTLDLTDPVAVSRYFSRVMAQKSFQEFRQQGLGLREPISRAFDSIPTSGGPAINYTPENYQEGRKRLADYLRNP